MNGWKSDFSRLDEFENYFRIIHLSSHTFDKIKGFFGTVMKLNNNVLKFCKPSHLYYR